MQLTGQENIAARKVRHFAVYKSAKLIFKAEAKPGLLQSVGQTGTGPKHAWINTLAFRSSGEQEWLALLRQAKNFDGFLKLLIANGYDLFSVDKVAAPLAIAEGHRIVEGDVAVGVIWSHAGQCSTLQAQPEVGKLSNTVASMVVYDTQKGSSLGQVYERARSYEALLEAIKSTRMKATPL